MKEEEPPHIMKVSRGDTISFNTNTEEALRMEFDTAGRQVRIKIQDKDARKYEILLKVPYLPRLCPFCDNFPITPTQAESLKHVTNCGALTVMDIKS